MSARRWRVAVRETFTHVVEVDAYSYSDAIRAGEAAYVGAREPAAAAPDRRVDVLEMVGEPWVLGACAVESPSGEWLKGRPDGYMETKDLLVFERSYDHAFSIEEVDLLRRRVEAAVGPVAAHWNGVGCGSLSIRTKRAFEQPLTDEQVASILAPLPPPVSS